MTPEVKIASCNEWMIWDWSKKWKILLVVIRNSCLRWFDWYWRRLKLLNPTFKSPLSLLPTTHRFSTTCGWVKENLSTPGMRQGNLKLPAITHSLDNTEKKTMISFSSLTHILTFLSKTKIKMMPFLPSLSYSSHTVLRRLNYPKKLNRSLIPLLLSEYKLHKRRLENWPSSKIDFGLPIWELVVITTAPSLATRTMTLKAFIPLLKVLEYCWRHFTCLKLYNCFQIPHPLPRVASTPNRPKISRHWLNYLQTLDTLNHPTLLTKGLRVSLQTRRVNTKKKRW